RARLRLRMAASAASSQESALGPFPCVSELAAPSLGRDYREADRAGLILPPRLRQRHRRQAPTARPRSLRLFSRTWRGSLHWTSERFVGEPGLAIPGQRGPRRPQGWAATPPRYCPRQDWLVRPGPRLGGPNGVAAATAPPPTGKAPCRGGSRAL